MQDLTPICFLKGICVTPSRSAPWTCPTFLKLGDKFLVARAIRGIPALITEDVDLSPILNQANSEFVANASTRRLRLFFSHWISSITCFSLEDMFLNSCVNMDIVKQCEIAVTGKSLTYYDGMKSASQRFKINPLPSAFKDMRNDMIHEGVLSGSKNANKSKEDCAGIIAQTLNWLDEYSVKVLGIDAMVVTGQRWSGEELARYLPGISTT